MCERLVHPVQTMFPSHNLITPLLLPVHTQLLKISLEEKERQLSHHALRIISRLRTCAYCCELHVAMCTLYIHAVCITSASVWYMWKYDWPHECMYIRSVCVCVVACGSYYAHHAGANTYRAICAVLCRTVPYIRTRPQFFKK